MRPRPPPATRLDAVAVGTMLALCVIWGVQQVASKVALTEGMPPLFQALVRSLVAGPLLIAWFALRRGRGWTRTFFARDGTLWPGMLSAVLFGGEFILLFEGVKLTSASHAVILLYTSAFFTALGAHALIPGERLRPVNAAGLALAFAGVVATVGGGGAGFSLAGDALVLGAAGLWGMTTVLVKASRALGAAPPEKVLAYQLVGAIPILVVATVLGGEWHLPHASVLAWASLAYQCVVVAFASYLAWVWLIGRYPAGRLAAFSVLTPPLGVLGAWLLLGDPITWGLLAGVACVGVGLRLVNRG